MQQPSPEPEPVKEEEPEPTPAPEPEKALEAPPKTCCTESVFIPGDCLRRTNSFV